MRVGRVGVEEPAPRDSDQIRPLGDVHQTVPGISNRAMVHPNAIEPTADPNPVLAGIQDAEVPHDDVTGVVHIEAAPDQARAGAPSDNALVRPHMDVHTRAAQRPRHGNHQPGIGIRIRLQFPSGGGGHPPGPRSAGKSKSGFCEPHVREIGQGQTRRPHGLPGHSTGHRSMGIAHHDKVLARFRQAHRRQQQRRPHLSCHDLPRHPEPRIQPGARTFGLSRQTDRTTASPW